MYSTNSLLSSWEIFFVPFNYDIKILLSFFLELPLSGMWRCHIQLLWISAMEWLYSADLKEKETVKSSETWVIILLFPTVPQTTLYLILKLL